MSVPYNHCGGQPIGFQFVLLLGILPGPLCTVWHGRGYRVHEHVDMFPLRPEFRFYVNEFIEYCPTRKGMVLVPTLLLVVVVLEHVPPIVRIIEPLCNARLWLRRGSVWLFFG